MRRVVLKARVSPNRFMPISTTGRIEAVKTWRFEGCAARRQGRARVLTISMDFSVR